MVNPKNSLFNEDDTIDIIYLLKKIWIEKKLIFKSSISFFLIGCIFALLSPVVYVSSTTFIPQVSDDKMDTNNGLGALASLAGINLSSAKVTSDSYLSPLLYTKLAESEEFSFDIIEEEIINSKGEKLTIKEYLLSNKSSFNFNLLGVIKRNTIGLFINDELTANDSDVNKQYNFFSDKEFGLINSFKQKFSIELNSKEGYIKVTASDRNALISAQLVEKVTKNLQSKIIELRTKKIKERLEYSKKQYELKQLEFDYLVKKLAEFKDSNKSISTARFMSELQKLETEYQLQQNILINLAAEYNNNKINLNKDTPIFSVLDEVSVPNERSKPKRKLIVFIFISIGLITSVLYILLKEPLNQIIKKIKES